MSLWMALILCKRKKKVASKKRKKIHGSRLITFSWKKPITIIRNGRFFLATEKGASNWLSVIPIDEHGCSLHKRAFHDVLALRYGWRFENCPTHCVCGKSFSIEHALSCHCGGYTSIRHNEIRDITASLLSEVCNSVEIEPHPQEAVPGETFSYRSAITDDGARLDVAANGVWGGRFERAFFDVRILNPFAQSNLKSLEHMYHCHENEKKRQYEARIREIEHSSFTPLILSTTGGMGRQAKVLYKRLASMIADKRESNYNEVLWWMRCKLNFALLGASIMCIRGSHSSYRKPIMENIQLQLAESERIVD